MMAENEVGALASPDGERLAVFFRSAITRAK